MPTLPTHPFAVAGAMPVMAPDLYLGLALEDEDRPGAREYLGALERDAVAYVRAASETHVWAPCSVCGSGLLVPAPAVPKTPRATLKDGDGPRCRWTSSLSVDKGELKWKRCPGRHYPMHGPWLASHPLARQLDIVRVRPW